jgi:hypothetical protein
MDPDTFRGDGADVFWRRRVSVLTGVLVVVAVVAWACTSASGRPEGMESPQQTGPSGADAMVVSLPSPLASLLDSPVGSPAGSPGADAAGRAGNGVPGGSISAAPMPHSAASPSAVAAPKPRRAGDPCDAKDIVISLRGGQMVYEGDAKPSFLMTVVSTARVECTIDVGPRALELRISSGPDRVWSTADCVSGEGKDVQRLQRGIPYVRTIVWDRHRSGKVCGGQLAAAHAGTYVAATHMAGISSDRAVFRLR